ncbi:MAG: hypothetical protein SGCHY_001087, partial [Lobulomycetales sp.]
QIEASARWYVDRERIIESGELWKRFNLAAFQFNRDKLDQFYSRSGPKSVPSYDLPHESYYQRKLDKITSDFSDNVEIAVDAFQFSVTNSKLWQIPKVEKMMNRAIALTEAMYPAGGSNGEDEKTARAAPRVGKRPRPVENTK